MPIHLLWGDDSAALERAINTLIADVVDPAWSSINLSRLDGAETGQAQQALEEARTPPFGSGGRLVLLQRSPFCNACPSELADRFEAAVPLIPDGSHLLLVNPAKPDGRLRTTKALQKLVKAGTASEQHFQLPAVWDGAGQRQLVERTAADLKLRLEPDAVEALIEAIGNDSARLSMELQKLALHAESSGVDSISATAIAQLIDGQASNALQVGDALLEGAVGEAISRLDHPHRPDPRLALGEPAGAAGRTGRGRDRQGGRHRQPQAHLRDAQATEGTASQPLPEAAGPAAGCGSRSQTGRPTRRCLPRWAVGVTRERLRRKLASQ